MSWDWRTADWRRLKALVLDSVSSPITKRVVAKLIGFGSTKTYELVQDGKIPSLIVDCRNADHSKSVGCLDRSTNRDR